MMVMGPTSEMKRNEKYASMKNFTEKIKDNLFNPIFKSPKAMKITYSDPSAFFILVEVQSCGVASIPASHIRKGYRLVRLYGKNYEATGSRVMCLIE